MSALALGGEGLVGKKDRRLFGLDPKKEHSHAEDVISCFFENNGPNATRELLGLALDEVGLAKALAIHLNRTECSWTSVDGIKALIEKNYAREIAQLDGDYSPEAVISRFFMNNTLDSTKKLLGSALEEKGLAKALAIHLNGTECSRTSVNSIKALIEKNYARAIAQLDEDHSPEAAISRFFENNGPNATRQLLGLTLDEVGLAKALAIHLNRTECSWTSVANIKTLIEKDYAREIAELDGDNSPEAVISRFFMDNTLDSTKKLLGSALEEVGLAKALAIHLNRTECSWISVANIKTLIEKDYAREIAELDGDNSPEAVISRFFMDNTLDSTKKLLGSALEEVGLAKALAIHLNRTECSWISVANIKTLIAKKKRGFGKTAALSSEMTRSSKNRRLA